MGLKKKISKKSAEKLKPDIPEQKVEDVKKIETPDLSHVDAAREMINVFVKKTQRETREIVQAIKEIKHPVTEIQVQSSPPVKSLHVRNVSRDARGFIKDMDIDVKHERVH